MTTSVLYRIPQIHIYRIIKIDRNVFQTKENYTKQFDEIS